MNRKRSYSFLVCLGNVLLLFLFITSSFGQALRDKSRYDFFPQNDLTKAGVYYYPEQWPEAQWERDIKKIAELGFEFTHFAEFSWSKLEPTEGNFQFSWLDKAIGLAFKNGLKIVLCTPTPTPPAWLSQKHPEILMVTADGKQMQHGGRQFASWSSEVYRSYVAKIVKALAQRYGNDKRIWGWQIDNEPSHYEGSYDYSSAVRENFIIALKEKYKNINALNTAWGNSFWSQEYNDFDQIHLPNQKAQVQPVNPHALLDFQEFHNEQLGEFIRLQANTLKKQILPTQFITTNYNGNLPVLDPFVNRKDLDFASLTFYPVNSWSGDAGGALGFRLGAGLELSFFEEFCKSVNGYTGIMELQPGQVNWGQYNSQPLPGAVRMWIWHTFSLGADFVCTYRFRQPLFGNEQYHSGIIGTDGVTLSRGGTEYVQALKELKTLRQSYKAGAVMPASLSGSATGIIWDQRSMLDMKNFPHTSQWDAMRLLFNYYTTLKLFGAPVTFLGAKDEFNPVKIPFLIVPSVQLVDKELVEKWTAYAKAGGHLIITCRTAQKDRDAHLWEASLQQPIYSLIGAEIQFNDHLPPGKAGMLDMNGVNQKWEVWAEVLKPLQPSAVNEETKIVASYADQFYKGAAAIVSRKIGKGDVTYVGTCSNDGSLEKQVLNKIYKDAGTEVMHLPPFVFYQWRDGFHVICNYSSSSYEMKLSEKDVLLFGTKVVEPGKVLVWK